MMWTVYHNKSRSIFYGQKMFEKCKTTPTTIIILTVSLFLNNYSESERRPLYSNGQDIEIIKAMEKDLEGLKVRRRTSVGNE